MLAATVLALLQGARYASSGAEGSCAPRFIPAREVRTSGAAGFEYFRPSTGHGDGGGGYLVVANFWDGRSRTMDALSEVFSLESARAPGGLAMRSVQTLAGKGAHGADVLTAHGRQLLVVPSYYGCGSTRGAATERCKSTAIYEWREQRESSRPGGAFVEVARLATAGPAQSDHFEHGGDQYIVVGENFGDTIAVYRIDEAGLSGRGGGGGEQPSLRFPRVQTLPCEGSGAMAILSIAGEVWLVATSYHSKRGGWRTSSPVFRWHVPAVARAGRGQRAQLGGSGFVQEHSLPSVAPHDAEAWEMHGRAWLFLAQDRDESSSRIDSQLFVFDAATRRFVGRQRMATDGAHGAEHFQLGDDHMLAVANFGDRHSKRYAALSSIWRWDVAAEQFAVVATLETSGATDFEHFVLPGGQHYLAVSNEGDVQKRLHQVSVVYHRHEYPDRNPELTEIYLRF
jgi:hypothetical protein